MKGDVGLFDAHFFNLSAETAAVSRKFYNQSVHSELFSNSRQALDPQFRLQLESTYEALESGTNADFTFVI